MPAQFVAGAGRGNTHTGIGGIRERARDAAERAAADEAQRVAEDRADRPWCVHNMDRRVLADMTMPQANYCDLMRRAYGLAPPPGLAVLMREGKVWCLSERTGWVIEQSGTLYIFLWAVPAPHPEEMRISEAAAIYRVNHGGPRGGDVFVVRGRGAEGTRPAEMPGAVLWNEEPAATVFGPFGWPRVWK